MSRQQTGTAEKIILGLGVLIGLWAGAALVSGLAQVGSVTELIRQYMVATGIIKPLSTEVDYYTHIKGIEYLICVAFFIVFPVFYSYINKEQTKNRRKLKLHIILDPSSRDTMENI
jgi:hypothetical protein